MHPFDEFVGDMAARIDALTPRSRAAVFWMLGQGLTEHLSESEEWAGWSLSAREAGRRFVVTGEVDDDAEALWKQASAPADGDAHQLANSAVICLSTPLGIALGAAPLFGPWVAHAFFPVMERASHELFGDTAAPGGEQRDLDAVFQHPSVQGAVGYCTSIVTALADVAEPDETQLEHLARGSMVLTPQAA